MSRFQAMIRAWPTSELPRFSLGQTYFDAGMFELAESTFAELCEMKPDYMMAYVLRTKALAELSRYLEARQTCRTAIRLAQEQNHRSVLAECEWLLAEIESELP
ncbi:MAG: molecular chaperone DnaJ [Myxococcales bacterium]|nr:molecular chaperone DnaJ [Myxococcales bacterium]